MSDEEKPQQVTEIPSKDEQSEESVQVKRPAEESTVAAEANGDKPSKKHKRRRNYDDIDEKIVEEDKASSSKQNKDEDSESDLDDEKLDQIMAKDDEDEDDLSEIDTSNIITGGRRTRGKIIDYKKTAKELDNSGSGKAADDEDEEDDEEFKAPEPVTTSAPAAK